MMAAVTHLTMDSHQSKLSSSPRCSAWFSLIRLESPHQEKYLQLRRIYYWSPPSYVVIYLYPPLTHTHIHSLSPFYRQGVPRRYTQNITTELIDSGGRSFSRGDGAPGEMTSRSTKSETPLFEFCVCSDWWGFMLPCPLLYCTSKPFITLMPFQWCHPEVMLKQGPSVGLWLAEALPRPGQWLRGEAGGCHEMGQTGGGASLAAPVMQRESMSNPLQTPPKHRSVPPAIRRRRARASRSLSKAPILQLAAAKWAGRRGRWREDSSGARFWREKTEQSNISGPAIPE